MVRSGWGGVEREMAVRVLIVTEGIMVCRRGFMVL